MKKIALVTGASSGIGMETSLLLLDAGFTVYGAARHLEKMRPIEEKGGHALYLDLTDESSLVRCVAEIVKNEGRIDVLVNNAGFGLGGAIEDIPVSEAKREFEVNVFSLARMCQLVLPSMRKNGGGKIINISSMAGKFSSPFSGWYHASKYSVEALSDSLRLEVKPFNIKVILIEPGLIQTDWGVIHARNIRKFSCAPSSAYSKISEPAAKFYEHFYSDKKNCSNPSIVSKTILRAALKKNPRDRYAAGRFSKLFILSKKIFPDFVFDFFECLAFGIKK